MRKLTNLYVRAVFPLVFIISAGLACGPHKYGISRDVNPKEDVHVFLHQKIIISGFTHEGRTKLVDQVNNEKMIFDFFLPAGEREIFLKTVYTKGIYSFMSQSVPIAIKAAKGDFVFICADIKEIGSRYPTGGNVEVLLTPLALYLKTDEEKTRAMNKDTVNSEYFDERCNAAVYGK